MTAAEARAKARAIASILGRTQAPELVQSTTWTALQNLILPVRLNLSRFCESLEIILRFRAVIGTANYTTVGVEAPQTALQTLSISGQHRVWNNLNFLSLSGATLFAWPRLFQAEGNALYIDSTSGAGTAPVKIANLTVPMGLAGATFGNTGTYDIEIHYQIPFSPWLGLHGSIKEVPFWLNPKDWSDTIQLQFIFGDISSFGVPAGGTTLTLTAYGSGAGSPGLEVYANYGILAGLADGIQSAVVVRNERTQTGGPIAAAATAVRMLGLDHQKITNLLIKAGTVTAAPSAGVQVYQTLSDLLLDKPVIRTDNKPVKQSPSWRVMKEYAGRQFNAGRVQGYLPISFIEASGDPLTYYRGDRLTGGANFEFVADVLSTTTRATFGIVQEEVYGVPGATF